MNEWKRSSGYWIVGTVVLAGIAAGFLLSTTSPPGAAGGAVPENISPDTRLRYVIDLSPEETQAFALEWGSDGMLWFVGSSADGSLTLNRYDEAADRREQWQLPGTAGSGPNTYLVQADDGSWWIGANYSVWRFEPALGRTTVAVALDRKNSLQTQDADDASAPLPGTWINGLGLAGGHVLMTRNNVRALFEVTPDGQVELSHATASAPRGLAVVDGVGLAYSSKQEAVEAAGGSPLIATDDGATFVAEAGCRMVLDPASSSAAISGQSSQVLRDLALQARDVGAISEGGKLVAIGMSNGAAILRGPCGSGQTERFQLPVRYVPMDDPRLRGGHILAERQAQFATVKSSLLALAINSAGHVAFSDDAMHLVIID